VLERGSGAGWGSETGKVSRGGQARVGEQHRGEGSGAGGQHRSQAKPMHLLDMV
jgi:hypothetical protein